MVERHVHEPADAATLSDNYVTAFFEDRAGVQAGLVGKGGCADIGRLAHRHAVEDIVELAASLGERFQCVPGDPGFIVITAVPTCCRSGFIRD